MNFQMRLLLLFRALHLSLMKQMTCSPSLSQSPSATPPPKKGRKARQKVEKAPEEEEKDQSCWLYSGSNLSLFHSIFNIIVTLWSQELERKKKKKEEEEQFYKFKERDHVQQTDEVNKDFFFFFLRVEFLTFYFQFLRRETRLCLKRLSLITMKDSRILSPKMDMKLTFWFLLDFFPFPFSSSHNSN